MNFARRITNTIRNAFRNFVGLTPDEGSDELLKWLGIDRASKNIHEVTYYTCLKKLSESLAKLPIKFYQDTDDKGRIRAKPTKTSHVITNRPNEYMTPTTFWGTVELNRNHYGNAYVWMRWKHLKKGNYNIGRELQDMWIMPSNEVTVLLDNTGIFGGKGKIYYQYSDSQSGEIYVFPPDEVMHFKTFYTYNGIVGKPVKSILKDTIGGALESQTYMNNLYKSGLTASMAMQFTGDLDDDRITKLQNKYAKYLTGSKNAGKVVPVPIGLTLTPLNVKPVDAQFFELKKYSALQIAGAFGIKPNQINNYEKSSHSNSESQQLDFLVETMLYIIKQYEEEINYKALSIEEERNSMFYKMNENVVLRTDSKTKADIIDSHIDKGVYTVNYAKDLYDLPHVEGGDTTIVNGTYIPLTDVGKQYGKGSDKNE